MNEHVKQRMAPPLLIVIAMCLAGLSSDVVAAGPVASKVSLKCLGVIRKGGIGIVRTRLRLCTACKVSQGKARIDSLIDCAVEDPKDTVPRAFAKAAAGVANACSVSALEELGRDSCGATAAEVQECLRTTHDPSAQALCRTVHATTPLHPDVKAARKCERITAKALTSYALKIMSLEAKCLETVLRTGEGNAETCNLELRGIASARSKATASIEDACNDDLAATLAFCRPHAGGLADALERMLGEVECRSETVVALQFGRTPPGCEHACTQAVTSTTTTSSTSTTAPSVTTTTTSTSTTSTILDPLTRLDLICPGEPVATGQNVAIEVALLAGGGVEVAATRADLRFGSELTFVSGAAGGACQAAGGGVACSKAPDASLPDGVAARCQCFNPFAVNAIPNGVVTVATLRLETCPAGETVAVTIDPSAATTDVPAASVEPIGGLGCTVTCSG